MSSMGSNSTLQLPLIDLSGLDNSEPGNSSWDTVQNAVRQALEEYGCFEALYDKITKELHDDVFTELEELFNLPAETKRRFVDSKSVYDGYRANPPLNPLHEVMRMGDVLNSGAIGQLADLLWPEGNTKFRYVLSKLFSNFHRPRIELIMLKRSVS